MKVLVVVDLQNDFIDGALGTQEAREIVSRVKEKIDKYLEAGDRVIFTQDTHGDGYLQTQEGQKLPVEHCIRGTRGWEIAQKVQVKGCPVVEKPTFGSLELAEMIAGLGEVQSIELVGIATDICVISNALILKAKLPEVLVTVDASCCAGITPQSHENALAAMKMCQIEITGS